MDDLKNIGLWALVCALVFFFLWVSNFVFPDSTAENNTKIEQAYQKGFEAGVKTMYKAHSVTNQ